MSKELLNRNCPVCNTESKKVFCESNYNFDELDGYAFASRKLPEYMHLRLLTCASCEIVFASPALKPEVLGKLYRDADFDSSVESSFAARSYASSLKKFLNRNERKFAVDVGAGDGTFLKELVDLGFEKVEGLEPSLKPILAANEGIRPFLKQTLFKKSLYPVNSLSLVTCFQTLEHISEPAELASSAFEMLKPGGGFMVVAHNKDALSVKILGKKSPIFDIEHLQLFSSHGLKTLLTRAGFSQIQIKELYNTYPLHYWVKLFPLPRPLKIVLLNLLRKSRIGNIPISLKAGNLVAYGTK